MPKEGSRLGETDTLVRPHISLAPSNYHSLCLNESAILEAIPPHLSDDSIKSRIFTIRGVQVMLDRDLAPLYGVQTKALNQAVKRNHTRFPEEFSFFLSKDEQTELVTNCDRFTSMKHSSVPMRAFSEHGVIMLAREPRGQPPCTLKG